MYNSLEISIKIIKNTEDKLGILPHLVLFSADVSSKVNQFVTTSYYRA